MGSQMLQEVEEVNTNSTAVARGERAAEDALPVGSAPVAARADNEVEPDVEGAAVAAPEPETSIKIGGREFKTQSEAIAYAESLENEKLVSEAYAAGIRETLQATQKPIEAPVVEDNFDEKFYSNPRQALNEVKEQAKAELRAETAAAAAERAAWDRFSTAHPDLAGSEKEVRRILEENWDVLGKLSDEKRAMEILATKTRSYFQDIADRFKARTELSGKTGQVVSLGGSAPKSVTQPKKEDRPLTMSEQLRSLRG